MSNPCFDLVINLILVNSLMLYRVQSCITPRNDCAKTALVEKFMSRGNNRSLGVLAREITVNFNSLFSGASTVDLQ